MTDHDTVTVDSPVTEQQATPQVVTLTNINTEAIKFSYLPPGSIYLPTYEQIRIIPLFAEKGNPSRPVIIVEVQPDAPESVAAPSQAGPFVPVAKESLEKRSAGLELGFTLPPGGSVIFSTHASESDLAASPEGRSALIDAQNGAGRSSGGLLSTAVSPRKREVIHGIAICHYTEPRSLDVAPATAR